MAQHNKRAVLNKIAEIAATVVLIMSISVCIVVIASIKSSTGMAQLFGYSFLSVKSNSMAPIFGEGDLIIIKCGDGSSTAFYEVGEIVSYISYDDYGNRFINTHRVVGVQESEYRNSFITKGDNVDQPDEKKVYANKVLGVYTGTRIPVLGTVFDYVSSGAGVLLCVVLPSAIIVIWQIIEFAKNSSAKKKEYLSQVVAAAQGSTGQFVADLGPARLINTAPAVSMTPEQLEFEKQRIIKDYLAQQQAEEARKQAVIDEYIARQKAEADKKSAEAEAEKIKAIISEFLAQQQATGTQPSEDNSQDDEQEPQSKKE